MRIAQVAPLYESVPPRLYGGTERVVSYLTEELVQRGHEVTLFASGDSQTSAELVPCCREALRLDASCIDPHAHHMLMLERVAQRADEFDVIHFHTDYFSFPLGRRLGVPQLVTLHGRLDLPDLGPIFDEFSDYPAVSISDHQRLPLPQAHWVGTVHHGLPVDLHQPSFAPGEYFAFLGRISPEKRVDRAVEIAKRAGVPLKIAAKVAKADEAYFQQEIAHLFDDPLIEFVGEIGEDRKGEFLRGAKALLFPIDWPEPFGLVMIEAMACGTPVIAFSHGSVPEVLEHAVSGFLVDDLDAAVDFARRVDELDRRRCRAEFERRFTAARMAEDYEAVYESLVRRASQSSVRPLPKDAA
ncbi:MAG: glycosyltransferase family 4 protein [Myxococcales bacterium]|jgi:glycosyltransferase involved in cell wall biosynthesis|nr:glycosyltransferase family 4 protein [Myxococcales bacterium]